MNQRHRQWLVTVDEWMGFNDEEIMAEVARIVAHISAFGNVRVIGVERKP